MAQPVGYYSLDPYKPLIADMRESWGEGLQDCPDSDKYWLIGRIGHELWLALNADVPPSENAEEVTNRLNELETWEAVALIRALIQ